MEMNNWIKIRESRQKGKFELWNAKSGKLYGIDALTKMLIENNTESIQNEENLETLMGLINSELRISFNNNDYELGENGSIYIVVSKDSQNQFIINEICFDLCKLLDRPKTINEVFAQIKDMYDCSEENLFDILDIIVKLVTYKILVL